LARERPELLQADLAILLEPTNGLVEGGCQGTLRAVVTVPGERAHTARPWRGVNAIHRAAPVLERLAGYQVRQPRIDGLDYYESVSVVAINGGVAGNVVPDQARITVNFRFAPDRTEAEALAHVQQVLAPFECVPTDSAPAAQPRLGSPAAAAFVAAIGGKPQAKLGWTDVARFAALGIPAVNFGPGDPNLAHSREEHVDVPRIAECERLLRGYLSDSPAAGG
jgi:succinyl-diaminopimelate desuccinylase